MGGEGTPKTRFAGEQGGLEMSSTTGEKFHRRGV